MPLTDNFNVMRLVKTGMVKRYTFSFYSSKDDYGTLTCTVTRVQSLSGIKLSLFSNNLAIFC